MRLIIIICFSIIISSCGKPKTVLICGDHVCVNQLEADQYFENNLSIEVKVVNKKENKDSLDLVQLNLREDFNGNRSINIFKKEKVTSKLKTLSTSEKNRIKKEIKRKKKLSKNLKKNEKIKKKTLDETNELGNDKKIANNKKISKTTYEVFDVCTIIKKCNINEISKYLLKEGANKKFPDITKRQ